MTLHLTLALALRLTLAAPDQRQTNMAAGTPPTSEHGHEGHPGPCDYFMLRVSRLGPGATDGLSGLIERLGTGEKHAFGSVAELVRLISSGAFAPPSDRTQD